MRRSVSSWSTLLSKLGFTRSRRNARKPRRKNRQTRIENLEARQMLACSPIGDEQLANSYLIGAQSLADSGTAIAGNANGYWATWQSASQDGSGSGVYAQRFNAAGQAQGAEFRANTCTAGDQTRPAVAMAEDGSTTIVWQSAGQDGSGSGIFAQRYDAAGQTIGSEVRLNATTQNDQEMPAVTHLADGRALVVWSGRGDGDNSGVFGRVLGADGVPQGTEFRINSSTQAQQKLAAVAATSDGGFVATWTSYGAPDGDSLDVYFQRFDGNAQKLGGETRANTFTSTQQHTPRSRPARWAVSASPGRANTPMAMARRSAPSGLIRRETKSARSVSSIRRRPAIRPCRRSLSTARAAL